MNDYPEEEDLQRIKEWPTDDPNGLIEFVGSLWWMPEFGFRIGRKYLYLSTAGWSGNEDIIGALRENDFWFFNWQESRRGGHYRFRLPRKAVDSPATARTAPNPTTDTQEPENGGETL